MNIVNPLLSGWLRWLGGEPCFRVFGKARQEADWRLIDVFATARRDLASRWPLWSGTCITWTDRVIVVGWDFAERVLREQQAQLVSRDCPVNVAGGRLRDLRRRLAAGAASYPSASEVLAHECGHTYQARHMGTTYLPLVGAVTLFREGSHWWNYFENRASEDGQFGGLVNGSVSAELIRRVDR
jgi:hypothetical protein